MPLVNEVNDKMCKRTVHVFSHKSISCNCCGIKPCNKTMSCSIAHRLLLLDCIICPVHVICSVEGSEERFRTPKM